MSLLTYADLARTMPSGQTAAQRAVARMQNPTAPMPPSGLAAVPADQIAAFSAWVDAGMPQGGCSAGSGSASDPLNAAPTCTSGSYYVGGDDGTSIMNPGGACIACHAGGEGPRFSIAGTVYPTGHEPTMCFGATAGTVVITDATGAVISLPVNDAGNFSTLARVVFPIHAKVVDGNGKERGMAAAQPTGDCNGCHTQDGASGAPGRIVSP